VIVSQWLRLPHIVVLQTLSSSPSVCLSVCLLMNIASTAEVSVKSTAVPDIPVLPRMNLG